MHKNVFLNTKSFCFWVSFTVSLNTQITRLMPSVFCEERILEKWGESKTIFIINHSNVHYKEMKNSKK